MVALVIIEEFVRKEYKRIPYQYLIFCTDTESSIFFSSVNNAFSIIYLKILLIKKLFDYRIKNFP